MTNRLDPSLGTDEERAALTKMHRAFRYPAKFHGPYARSLLERFSADGDRVVDPFCGSGTLLLEGKLLNRRVDGYDVDPLACFISTVKAQTFDLAALAREWGELAEKFDRLRRSKETYLLYCFEDLTDAEFEDQCSGMLVPDIPRIEHWFRRYVIVDLARIFAAVRQISGPERPFFELCAASIIRLSSNADPVPVSGLEVTSHMRKRDERGRLVDPFALFSRAVKRNLAAIESYERLPSFSRLDNKVEQRDGTSVLSADEDYDALITSPPYHGAVDYYRRHTLEMYWLGLTETHEERLQLLPKYLGRVRVGSRDLGDGIELTSSYAQRLAEDIQAVDPARARGFVHYVAGIQNHFAQACRLVRREGVAVYMVGNSRWRGHTIDTPRLLRESMGPDFTLDQELVHEVKNRYMSYTRHNDASIDQEHSLVFRRIA